MVDRVDKWGRRKLAYPIRKFMEANYILTRFKLEPKLIKEVETEIKASEEILRYLVVKAED
jgi:small subunit ribosomal protein S6